MTDETNVQTTKVNPYVFTDAIFAAVTIDGLATAIFFAMPFVPIGVGIGGVKLLEASVEPETFKAVLQTAAPAIEIAYSSISTIFPVVSSIKEYSFYIGINILSGFSTYVIRDYTRDDFKKAGCEHYNGVLGGGVKYIENELAGQLYNQKTISVTKIAYKASLGARNNYKYEKCTANEECNKKALEFVVKTESGEAEIDAITMTMYHSYVAILTENKEKIDSIKFLSNPYQIPLKTLGGTIVGKVVSEICIKEILIPNMDSVHKISDKICEEYPILITAKDLFSETVDFASAGIFPVVNTICGLYDNSTSSLNEYSSLEIIGEL